MSGLTQDAGAVSSQQPVRRLTFQVSLLLAPLAYCLHQLDEDAGGFRAWRMRYFADNNRLSVEQVFVILTAVTLSLILWFSLRQSIATANLVLFLLMATQVNNALYHVITSLIFRDYSPGTLTAVVLYLPVNLLIWRQALREGWATRRSLLVLFVLGAAGFWAFELIGPALIVLELLAGIGYVLVSEVRGRPEPVAAERMTGGAGPSPW